MSSLADAEAIVKLVSDYFVENTERRKEAGSTVSGDVETSSITLKEIWVYPVKSLGGMKVCVFHSLLLMMNRAPRRPGEHRCQSDG